MVLKVRIPVKKWHRNLYSLGAHMPVKRGKAMNKRNDYIISSKMTGTTEEK